MKRISLVVGGGQLCLVAVALWALYDTNVSSQQFSQEYVGQPLEYTWAGLLVPVAVSLAIVVSAVFNGVSRRPLRARWAALGSLLPLGLVVVWWLVLTTADWFGWATGAGQSVYTWFFVRSGALQPNEIFGASFPLFMVVALLSCAAFLGIVSLALNWRNTDRGSSAA